MKEYARELRRNQTDTEIKLWSVLRNKKFHGFKFRRQHCIPPYVVDFVCLEKKLIIELDGSQHQLEAEYDMSRTKFLKSKGFKVIRFWNNEALQNLQGVLEIIYENLI